MMEVYLVNEILKNYVLPFKIFIISKFMKFPLIIITEIEITWKHSE